MKEDVGLGTSFSVLRGRLHFKLREFVDEFVERCIQSDVIELDGKLYCYSDNFLDFQAGPLKFTERQFLTELYCQCVTNDDDWPCIDAVSEGYIDGHDLGASLSELSEMGIIKREGDLITPGAHFNTNNAAWLRHCFLKELTVM